MSVNKRRFQASCHCGVIKLHLELSDGINELIRCDCSMCLKGKGYAMICIPSKKVKLKSGLKYLKKYTFNTGDSPHFFCSICGIHTHHNSRARPDRICVNAACIEDVNLASHSKDIISFDGVNHPKDN